MLKEFQSNIAKNGLFHKKQSLLLAVSGGVDSVALAHLLKESGYNFSMAHCNFQLRGKESDADEKFCKELSKKSGIKIYTKAFDTKAYCAAHKINIQLAARKLRYDWFHELLKAEGFDYILTAHHANDVIETIFINLLRGTGIKGLKGIPEKKGQLVRPLLNFKREEIENYAKEKKIGFRVDKSNLEDKYERNFIRLNIIPQLKKINPRLEETFIKNTNNFRQESDIVKDYLEERSTDLITQTPEFIFINKKKLKHEKYVESVLHSLISGYDFNESQQKNILRNLKENALNGKIFLSSTHQLVIDRNDLVIKPLVNEQIAEVKINSLPELKKQALFSLSQLKKFTIPKKNEVILEKDQLLYPLIIRQKQTGDKFRPFGMKGFKLISDFLKDEKLNTFEKDNCRLLVNGNGEIIWVIGYRSDERYKVNIKNTDLVKLTSTGKN